MSGYPYHERKDGPFYTRTDVYPVIDGGMVVQQGRAPVGDNARIFIPFEDWPQIREMMQAVYDKHAKEQEAKR